MASFSLDDCRLRRLICEVRYDETYLVYDRTGTVFQELKRKFSDAQRVSAMPEQSSMKTTEGVINIELNQSRITKDDNNVNVETFAESCKKLFPVLTSALQVTMYTRIGLRSIFFKEYPGHAEAVKQIQAFNLLNRPKEKRFSASDDISEVIFRWQGSDLGTMLRLHPESGRIDAILPPELGESREFHKEINALIVDVDHYTVKPVDTDQWDPAVWIPQAMRIVRKEVDKILG